ncbi:MAG: reverse transcriptase domain-containing protein, partial [Gemmatimonadota bacterium]
PTARDRTVQAALKLVLEPIFEADFKPCSYGFRPGRRAHDAIAEIVHMTTGTRNYEWVLEGDIKACFDEIEHTALMDRVRRRVGDKRVLGLVKGFLKAGVLSEDGVERDTITGTPQGGIISPLLANIALSVLDEHFAEAWQAWGSESARWRRRRRGLPTYRIVRYADDCVTRTQGGIDVEGRTRRAVLCQRWRKALRDRPAGGGLKPPQAASVKSRGGERCGQGAPRARQVRAEKASESEPLMTCRKRIDDIETGVESLSRDEPGGDLLTAQAVSGIKAARAQLRLWCGTCEPVAPTPSAVHWTTTVPRPREGGLQAAGTARGRVPMRGTGTDRLVVATMPGNAGGAKGAGHPGSLGGQP